MRKREHHMKVGRVYYLRPSLIHPDFFQDCLTVRAVAVTAGVVMNLHMPAVTTLAYVIAQFSRLFLKRRRLPKAKNAGCPSLEC